MPEAGTENGSPDSQATLPGTRPIATQRDGTLGCLLQAAARHKSKTPKCHARDLPPHTQPSPRRALLKRDDSVLFTCTPSTSSCTCWLEVPRILFFLYYQTEHSVRAGSKVPKSEAKRGKHCKGETCVVLGL